MIATITVPAYDGAVHTVQVVLDENHAGIRAMVAKALRSKARKSRDAGGALTVQILSSVPMQVAAK